MSLKIPVAPKIECAKDPKVPQFHFEWHTVTGKVYMIETPGTHVGREFVPAAPGPSGVIERRAVRIAEHVEHCKTYAEFYGHVQTWLRGYKKAIADYPKLRESFIVADIERIEHSGLLKGETDGR